MTAIKEVLSNRAEAFNLGWRAWIRIVESVQSLLQFSQSSVIKHGHGDPEIFRNLLARGYSAMNKSPATISGYVVALPRNVDEHQAIVAIIQDDVEYRILPRGAGVDLADEVNAMVEATGLVEEMDDNQYLAVRGYKVLEDDGWEE